MANMGYEIFKRYQRLQGGTEAVPSELPTPPDQPPDRGDRLRQYLFDQVRQGVLSDEALAEIKQNPTSMRSLMAYGEGALTVGTLLSGGGGEKLPLGGERVSMPKGEQYPQNAWDSIRQSATHVRKENPSHLVTVSPSLKDPDYSRINYWDNRGIISHLEIPSDRVDSELQRTAYPRGGVVLSVEGGIGGTLPSADYAGMGFYPSATGTKGVKAFVGPADSVDWMQSRLESGGYKVSVRPVPEEVPEKSGIDFFNLKAQQQQRGTSVVKGYGPTHAMNI